MNSYLADHKITVMPFTQRLDGEETIIANASQTTFLALPTSAVDILNWLAEDKTVGETQALYHEKYQELPDIEDFLELLESEGFVSSSTSEKHNEALLTDQEARSSSPSRSNREQYHFASFPQKIARRIFGPPVLCICFLCIIVGFFLAITDLSLIPSSNILVFKQNLTVTSISLFLFVFVSVFLHEMAHLIAARAADVPAKLGISHRLWIVVAQTDMTGIWMASKGQRLIAVLAGSLLDATAAGLLIMLLFAQQHGWVNLSSIPLLCCRIALFTYLLRLLWECYFFVRTDFYYVIAIAFNCKDLLGDTETFLRNQCSRLLPLIKRVDQSHIPVREMRVIRVYGLIWIVGRIMSLAALVFIGLPILLGYYFELGTFLLKGQLPGSLAPVDIVGWFILIMVPLVVQTAGFVLWIRSFFLARKVAHGKSRQ